MLKSPPIGRYVHQGSEALPHHGAVCSQGAVAMGDGNALAVLDLHDGLVVRDEETALGDVALQGRERLGFVYVDDIRVVECEIDVFRQALNTVL